jgi:hypothetical protein
MEQTTPNPVGRPSKYTPELLAKAKQYEANHKVAGEDEVLPTIEGLAIYLGIMRKTIYNWLQDEDKEDFLHIVESILAKQARVLISKGLTGDFNSAITKVILSKHNYSERQELDHTSSDGSMKPTVIELVAPEQSNGM